MLLVRSWWSRQQMSQCAGGLWPSGWPATLETFSPTLYTRLEPFQTLRVGVYASSVPSNWHWQVTVLNSSCASLTKLLPFCEYVTESKLTSVPSPVFVTVGKGLLDSLNCVPPVLIGTGTASGTPTGV